MPPSCFADTSGKRDISQNDPSPKSSPSESHAVAHLYHSKPPDGGSQIPKAKSTSHLADARGMIVCGASPLQNGKCNNSRAFYRAEFLTPTPGTTTQGHLLCLSGIQATCSGQFLSSRRGCRIGASQRTKVEAHTNMHFFVRSNEAREVMCPCPPGLTGSGAARGLDWSGESDELCWLPPLLEHRLEVRLRGLQSIMVRRQPTGRRTAPSPDR